MTTATTLADLEGPPNLALGDFRLRALRDEDAGPWSEYLCDPQVTLHTSWTNTDPASIQSLVRRLRADYVTKASWRWAIARASDDQLVGVCGFSTWSTVHGTAELVYDLSPHFWHRGIATAAVREVLIWAFSEAQLERVQAVVLPTNGPSMAVLDRCGFTREGVLRHYRLVNGHSRDFLLYSRLRNDPQPMGRQA